MWDERDVDAEHVYSDDDDTAVNVSEGGASLNQGHTGQGHVGQGHVADRRSSSADSRRQKSSTRTAAAQFQV